MNPPASPVKSAKTRVYVYTAAICLAALMFSFGNCTQGSLLGQYSDSYGLTSSSNSLISVCQSAGMLISLVFILLTGGLRRRRAILPAAAALTGVCFLLLSLHPSYELFCALYLLLGISYGQTDSAASALIAQLYAGGNSAMALGILHATIGLGGIVSPLVISVLLGGGDWRFVLTVYALLAIGVMAANVLCAVFDPIIPDRALPAAGQDGGGVKSAGKRLRPFFDRVSQPLLWTTGLYGGHQTCFALWVVSYMSGPLNSPDIARMALSLFWGGTFLSRLIVPALKLKTKTYSVVSMAATTAVLTAGVIIGNPIFFEAASFLAGLLGGAVISLNIAVLCEGHPEDTLTASALALSYTYIAQLAEPFLITRIFPNIDYRSAIIAATVMGALTIIPAVLIKEPKTSKNAASADNA